MATKMDIVNMALANIGHDSIGSLDEPGKDAFMMRIHYDNALNDVLRSHPWGFARRTAQIALLPETPPDFAYAYAYPADCAMARRLKREDMPEHGIIFQIGRSKDGRRKVILSNCPPPSELEYTTNLVQPGEFDPQFVTALAWRLSAAVTMGVHGDAQAHQMATETYFALLQLAKADDGREAKLPRLPDGDFLRSRRY